MRKNNKRQGHTRLVNIFKWVVRLAWLLYSGDVLYIATGLLFQGTPYLGSLAEGMPRPIALAQGLSMLRKKFSLDHRQVRPFGPHRWGTTFTNSVSRASDRACTSSSPQAGTSVKYRFNHTTLRANSACFSA